MYLSCGQRDDRLCCGPRKRQPRKRPSLPLVAEVDRILQAVQEAQARAQAAMDSAEAAAADLFAAKKAEVEAQALLAGETKPAKGKKGADAASAPGSEEAKAQELIRQNASAACADALKRAEEQAAAAAAAAKEAEEMLESAREALDAASTGQGDDLIESSVQARAAAEAASEKVRALVASAGQAAEAAAEAQKGAERALRQARRAAEHAGNPDELPAEDDEVAEAGSGEGAGADGAEGEAAGAGEETGEGGVEVKAEESVESRLRSLARGMGKEEAGSCWDAWRSGEARYLAALEELFGRVRRERADNVQYVAEKRAAMLAMLHAKDDRQSAVDTALEEIRSRVPDLFQDAAVRCEAVEAVDRMRDALWDMCDVKNSEADKSRKAVAGETYLAEHEKATVALFVEMIHVEMARLKDTGESLQMFSHIRTPTWAYRARTQAIAP